MALLPLLSLLVAVHAPADTTIRLGAKVPGGIPLPLATVAASPAIYSGREIVVEGVVSAVCQEQGCWMQITPDTSKGNVPAHVDFEHKFFVPMNAAGMKANVVGKATLKTYTKEQADHLVEEGAKVTRKADGTATGIQFIATGVELTGKLGTPVAKKMDHDMGGMKKSGGR